MEIHNIIVEYLDIESLLHYFASGEDQISIALHFAQLHPGLFFPTNNHPALPFLIHSISDNFSKMEFASLHRRWEVVEKIMASAESIQFINNKLEIYRSPIIGCFGKRMELARLKSVKTYYRRFHDHSYVCGICFYYPDTAIIAGESSSNYKSQSASGVKEIRFLVDSFGVRGLQLGLDLFPKVPHHMRCWEGLLRIDQCVYLQVITDVRQPMSLLCLI